MTWLYIFVLIYMVSTLIVVGDLVCRASLTHRGPGHQFLDELSLMFTTLDGRVVAQYFRACLDSGSGITST